MSVKMAVKSAGKTYRPLDQMAVILMFVLCACWGSQQVTMKAIAHEMHPSFQVGLRSLVASLCVFLFMIIKREPLRMRDGTFLAGLAAGLLFALEFLFVSIGLNYTTASHMSVFLYTSPLFTAIGLHFMIPEERMQGRQWWGILLAFIGVVVIFADGFLTPVQAGTEAGSNILLGDAFGMLAGILWALTTLVIKGSPLKSASAAKTLLYQLGMTALLLLIYSHLQGVDQIQLSSLSRDTWMSLAYQTFIIAFASLLAWFWLLTQYLASRLSVFSFLTPVYGMIFGVLFLQDPLTINFLFGALMIFIGIILVNFKGRLVR